ncbi:GTPase-activating protein gyp8 [Entomophthora muscae]|uniref:GTPase-activating protein gyp8 n=1 Tax=Entomophthora muscae TaxID=34485 RepID=A0ACC2T128_9FUNG|nr:GTPase-activating protein gyp8 [Entomophthora muscae]
MARSDLDEKRSEENPFSSSGRRKMRAYFDPKPSQPSTDFSPREKGSSWQWMLSKGKYVATEFLGAIRNPVPVEFNTRDELPTMLWPNAGGLTATTGNEMVDRAASKRQTGGAKIDAKDLLQLMVYPDQTKQKTRGRSNSVTWAIPSPIVEDEEHQLTTSEIRSRKEEEISAAISAKDRKKLLQLAVSDMGLINTKLRKEAWAMLLHAEKNQNKRSKVGAHRSDRQVEKECTGAFLVYPKKLDDAKRLEKQGELAQLIRTIFQREPELSHFQGFRDIAACFLLVMGRRRVANALQNVALFYFRDIMLGSLTPVLREMELGLRILARENSELVRYISEAGAQYYYCIAWVLSWTARGVPTLSVAARIFDTFLSSSPIFPVYFMTAMTMTRSVEIMRMPKEKSAVNAVLTRYPHDADVEKILASATKLFQRHPPERAFSAWRKELGPNTCTQRYKDDWVSIKNVKDYQASYTRVQDYIAQARPAKEDDAKSKENKSDASQPTNRSLFKKLIMLLLFLGVLALGVFGATKVQIKISLADASQPGKTGPLSGSTTGPVVSETLEPAEGNEFKLQETLTMPEGALTDAEDITKGDSNPAEISETPFLLKTAREKLPDITPFIRTVATKLQFLSPYIQTATLRLQFIYPYAQTASTKLSELYPYIEMALTKLKSLYPYVQTAGTQLEALVPYAQKAGLITQDLLIGLKDLITKLPPLLSSTRSI